MDKELLLYRYFSNQLTEAERQLFDALLEKDADFKAQFSFESNLKRVIKDDRNVELKVKLAEFEKDVDSKIAIEKPKTKFRQWSVAASIVLLFGLGLIGYNSFFRTDYYDLFDENFDQYPNTVYTITRGDTSESLERDAFAAYESGNFQKALDNFEKIPEADQKIYFDFYRAQAYLNLGDTGQAAELFKTVASSGGEFEAEAQWYLALSYLRAKDAENTRDALQKLTLKYSYNKEKALELLKELN